MKFLGFSIATLISFNAFSAEVCILTTINSGTQARDLRCNGKTTNVGGADLTAVLSDLVGRGFVVTGESVVYQDVRYTLIKR